MVTRVREKKAHERTQEFNAPESCAHYWLIESANGPTSYGICRICGARKEFLNAIPEAGPPVAKKEKNPLDLPEMERVSLDGKHNRS